MPVTDSDLLKQVHFSGEAKCDGFSPHKLRPNFCVECNKLFDKHTPELIPDEECLLEVSKKNTLNLIQLLLVSLSFLLKALSYSQKAEKVPSTIEPPSSDGKTGGLFLGGFRGVMNEQFLKDSNIKFIVNTAKGLEIFGPKYMVSGYYRKSHLPRDACI